MIEDPELRSIFREENDERVNRMETCFTQIEKNPADGSSWDELLRDLHTLKGSARMLGISSLELLSHHLEDLLGFIRKNLAKVFPYPMDFFFELLDAIKALIVEETEGKDANVDVPGLIQKVNIIMKDLQVNAEQAKPAFESPLSEPVEREKVTAIKGSQRSYLKHSSEKLQVSSIRVQIDQINKLMALATEISIVRTQMERLFEQVEELSSLWQTKNGFNEAFSEKVFEEKLLNLRSYSYDHIHKMQMTTTALVDGIRSLSLIPISKLFSVFPSMVREIAKSCHKEINFVIESEDIGVDRKIIEELKDPLMHILRNAISHGIESTKERKERGKEEKGNVELKARQTEKTIIIEVIDDGAGVNLEEIKRKALEMKLYTEEVLLGMSQEEIEAILFMPGFSTAREESNISGRGVGLDAVLASIQKLNGSIQVKSHPGSGTTFLIELPMSFVTSKVMLVKEKEKTYAIPMDLLKSILLVSFEEVLSIEGQEVIYVGQELHEVFFLKDLLFEQSTAQSEDFVTHSSPCLIFKTKERKIALFVESILEEQELVLVPVNILPFELKGLAGLTILKSGEICFVFNPLELIRSAEHLGFSKLYKRELPVRKKTKALLIVDDSSLSRAIIRQSLEAEGYQLEMVENAEAALEKWREQKFDAIITDIEMPNMNGYEMISIIRTSDYFIPIIIYSSLFSEQHKKKSLESGATAQVVKSLFSQDNLLKILKDIFG